MILAGDVGATKTILALFDEGAGAVEPRRQRIYASGDFAALEDVIRDFLQDCSAGEVRGAGFGVAGPVVQGRARLTNLPWTIDSVELAAAVGVARVALLNDIEAMSYGMLFLRKADFAVLQEGGARRANMAVVAPGTGLGEGILYWNGTGHHPVASEGGHRDFGARNEQEIDLLRYLRATEAGHVSYEHVLSGPGLQNIYRFLRDSGREHEPDWLRMRLDGGDAAAVIAAAGLAGEADICVSALDLFCAILGAEAANLALTCMAVGGVFLGGGIPAKILPALQRGGFARAFADKGRFAEMLRGIPVKVALTDRAALIGAARLASS